MLDTHLLAQERGIRSNFTCAAKEDAHTHDGSKGRAQRVKGDREDRTEEWTTKKISADARNEEIVGKRQIQDPYHSRIR